MSAAHQAAQLVVVDKKIVCLLKLLLAHFKEQQKCLFITDVSTCRDKTIQLSCTYLFHVFMANVAITSVYVCSSSE